MASTAQTDTGMTWSAVSTGLMDELNDLAAAAGGWRSQIPAADKAARMERKGQLLADIQATIRRNHDE